MKITFFIGSISGGGAERVMCNLANFLAGKGHETNILTISKNRESYGLNGSIKTYSLEGAKRIKFAPLRILLKMHRLKKFVKTNETDIYVVFLPKTVMALFRYKKYIKAPIVFTESTNPRTYKEKKLKKLINCFGQSDGAVFLTADAEKFYLDKIPLKSSIVIPNAVNPEVIREQFAGERRKAVVAVGRHVVAKNFPLLINAFSKVVKEYTDYTLEIYGRGELTDEYKKQCEALGITDKVVFPGFCDNVQDRIYDASLFVLSSDYEGIPVALIEAMALGLPCVSTDCAGGGAKFLINNGENGILVPPKDENALAAAIKKVLSDNDLAKTLSVNARAIVEKLSPDKIYSTWETYLNKVIRNEI